MAEKKASEEDGAEQNIVSGDGPIYGTPDYNDPTPAEPEPDRPTGDFPDTNRDKV
jgi:hypothetical protein